MYLNANKEVLNIKNVDCQHIALDKTCSAYKKMVRNRIKHGNA